MLKQVPQSPQLIIPTSPRLKQKSLSNSSNTYGENDTLERTSSSERGFDRNSERITISEKGSGITDRQTPTFALPIGDRAPSGSSSHSGSPSGSNSPQDFLGIQSPRFSRPNLLRPQVPFTTNSENQTPSLRDAKRDIFAAEKGEVEVNSEVMVESKNKLNSITNTLHNLHVFVTNVTDDEKFKGDVHDLTVAQLVEEWNSGYNSSDDLFSGVNDVEKSPGGSRKYLRAKYKRKRKNSQSSTGTTLGGSSDSDSDIRMSEVEARNSIFRSSDSLGNSKKDESETSSRSNDGSEEEGDETDDEYTDFMPRGGISRNPSDIEDSDDDSQDNEDDNNNNNNNTDEEAKSAAVSSIQYSHDVNALEVDALSVSIEITPNSEDEKTKTVTVNKPKNKVTTLGPIRKTPAKPSTPSTAVLDISVETSSEPSPAAPSTPSPVPPSITPSPSDPDAEYLPRFLYTKYGWTTSSPFWLPTFENAIQYSMKYMLDRISSMVHTILYTDLGEDETDSGSVSGMASPSANSSRLPAPTKSAAEIGASLTIVAPKSSKVAPPANPTSTPTHSSSVGMTDDISILQKIEISEDDLQDPNKSSSATMPSFAASRSPAATQVSESATNSARSLQRKSRRHLSRERAEAEGETEEASPEPILLDIRVYVLLKSWLGVASSFKSQVF